MGRGRRSSKKARSREPRTRDPQTKRGLSKGSPSKEQQPEEPPSTESLAEDPLKGRTWVRIVAVASVVLAAAVSMGPGLSGELLNWDDDRFVENNELIRGFDLSSISDIFAQPHFEAYHPLHLLSYMFDYELFGPWAPGYKFHNFALYIICLLLLFLLLRRLGLSEVGAFVATLIFAVHPLHVETVVWVTARKEPLSLAFMLGAALAYLRSKTIRDWAGITALVLFSLALLTKTSTVVLPALLLIIDVVVRRRPWRDALVHVLPLGLVALVVGLYVLSLWQENDMARPMPERGALGILALFGKTGFHYLSKMIWPSRLSPVYPIDREGAFDLFAVVGFVSWSIVLVFALRSRDRLLSLGALWIAVALLPVSNLVPVYFFVQDRYALIATVGAALILGRLADRFLTSSSPQRAIRWLTGGVLVAMAIALCAHSSVQASGWNSSLRLWQLATSAQPEAYYAFLALGHTERDRGELDEAIDAYSHAVALEPSLPYARISLCLADALRNAERQDRPRSEVDHIGSAIQQRWGDVEQLLDLAARTSARGYHGCAQLAEARAFDLRPPEPNVLIGAASRWVLLGKPRLALRYLERATEGSGEPDATSLEVEAQSLELLGRREEARDTLRRSLTLQPRPPQRLLAAAEQLLHRGRPELTLLYADVAGGETSEHNEEWIQLRRRARGDQRSTGVREQ